MSGDESGFLSDAAIAGMSGDPALENLRAQPIALSLPERHAAPFIFASHSYPAFDLLMPLFLCRRWEGIPQPHEGQNIAWVRPKDLAINAARYPMPAADIPLIPMLRDLL